MRNLLNDKTEIASVVGEDLEKLRTMKQMMNNQTFGNVMIESAFIMDKNMLYISDTE
jgi:hypothetical protein